MSRWPEVALGEVLIERQETPDPVEVELGTIPIVAKIGFDSGQLEFREGSGSKTGMILIRPGDLVISGINAYKGAIALYGDDSPGPVAATIHYGAYQANPDRVDARYLWWLLRSRAFRDSLARKVPGGVKTELRAKRLLPIPIPLPPVEEQRRVVLRIEQIAALLATAERVRLRVERDIEALAKAAFRQAFSAYGETSATTIDDVCTAVIDCLHSNPVYADTGIATMRSPDVGWGELKLDGALRTSEEEYRRRTQRGEPRPGDIILVREGGGTGRAGIVGEEQRLSLGQRVMLLRPDPARVDPRFLMLQWLSPRVQDDQIVPGIKGSASPHLNIGALRQFTIALPPLSEQVRLVDRLDQLLRRIECSQRLLAGAGSLTDAVLPSALSGL